MKIYLTLLATYFYFAQVEGGPKHKNSLPECGKCVKEKCPKLGAYKVEDCPRDKIIYDDCGCCSRCSLRIPVTGRPMGKGNPCDHFRCPRRQVCTLNMQKLPICMCLPESICDQRINGRRLSKDRTRGNRRKSRVCASNGETYPSRCHMKVASCHLNKKLRVVKKGSCKRLRKELYEALIGNYRKFKGSYRKGKREFESTKEKITNRVHLL